MAKTLKTVSLLEQPFIKDGDKSVSTIIKEAVSVLGENIQVRRFERCALLPFPCLLPAPTLEAFAAQHPSDQKMHINLHALRLP